MPSYGYGEKQWNNLESLMSEAISAKHHKKNSMNLSRMLGAIASKGPVRYSEAAEVADLGWRLQFDNATREWILLGAE